MKKLAVLVLLLVFLLSGCRGTSTPDANDSVNSENGTGTNFSDAFDTIYKQDKNYTVYTDGFSFCYKVNDNNGDLLDVGYHDYRGSLDLYYQNNLLVLEYGNGGNLKGSKRYYDLENGRVSRFFDNTVAQSDTKVAYFTYFEDSNKTALIVQDIFDRADYYIEIEREFALGTELYYNTRAVFSEDGKKLEIKYPVKPQNGQEEYQTEILELS